ncbi:rhodanese-like domain-containing protein [Alteromonas gilva]|uniref:Rhodanese-like domain-containing protein n=1 Tax=Alteromonas gilva TaxID=2987522 RepID=A0ABT5L4B9_9ALTE|nr:rhodanese-like domain-containing protein [Alteromonas gilva]MDC8830707.1 rhodanese-like domain-containing protein [Alteromonas gilva]
MLLSLQERLAAIDPAPKKITAAEAAAEKAQHECFVIDVREPSEHASSPAKGAINIPRGLLEMKILELVTDPGATIILHCASGARAMLAAEQLAKMGYQDVAVMSCDIPTIQKAFN